MRLGDADADVAPLDVADADAEPLWMTLGDTDTDTVKGDAETVVETLVDCDGTVPGDTEPLDDADTLALVVNGDNVAVGDCDGD